MKLDKDVREMSHRQRGREIMRLRRAFERELNHTGNRRCWINLLAGVRGGKKIRPLALSRKVFLGYCGGFYDRNRS